MNNKSFTLPGYRAAIFLVLALPALYAISRYNYLLFHSLADGISIVIAACVFVIIWNSRHLIDNDYFLYVGITFLFWAFLDFMHLLGNKNMGVFPAYGNLGPAFYIAGRYLLSISLIIAPFLINRKLNTTILFAVYSLITLLILLTILYWQIFPVCIVDGVGLTPFKVVSDYIICFILLGSIGLMIIKRRLFDPRVLWLIVTSIILSIATGLSFTLYTDPFGVMNMAGHLFQMASFYLIYLAFIETSLSRPQDILYQKLKQNKKKLAENVDQLKNANNELTKEITDRKQAEAALRVAEETYRNIFLNSQIGLFRTDLKTGLILDANDTVAHFIGYPDRASLMAKPFSMAERYVDSTVRGEMIALLHAHGEIHNHEARFRRNDGSIIWIRFSAKIVREKGWMEGVSEDITAQKNAEAEKEKLEAQNRQLQKSESLGRMAAAIAHHFNNQLAVVIGNLEMAIDEQPKGVAPSNSLTSAMQAAWRSADMSRLMLTYLGQSRDKVEPLDISSSCRKILPILKAAMPANVILETDFPSPCPVINTSPDYMQQILTNLITNAWESVGDDRGTISLNVKTVSPAEIPTAHRFPVDFQLPDNPYACLEVTDTGCGIAARDIEQIFDPFYSTKFTGRGMGLAVVLGLVKAHKGVITVNSKPGSGSTFRIFFPLSEDALRQPQTAGSERDVTTGSPTARKMEEGGTVLVVEDDAILRDMAAAMLESFGFTVLKAKDGVDALEIFGKHQSEIKFVLTDLTMPRMDGWETLTALRNLQPDIPVILASGYDLAHVMAGDHPELPQAFLGKPYNLKALSDAIGQALVNPFV